MIKFKVKVMLAMREMTQKELAEKTGIRPPTISAICTGAVKHLPVDALDKICAVLNCQPSDLMEYKEDQLSTKGCLQFREQKSPIFATFSAVFGFPENVHENICFSEHPNLRILFSRNALIGKRQRI